MASLNKVQIIGNLGRDPELKYLPSGDAIANLAVATSFKSKDKNTGELSEKVEWHRVTLFGRTAEVAGQYLRKGSTVYLEGRLQTRKYTDKDGVEKYATDIICETMQMLGGKGEGEQQPQQQERRQAPPAPAPSPREQARDRQHAASNNRPAPNFSDMDSDIPFSINIIGMSTATESRQLKRSQQGRVSNVEF